MSQEKEIDGFCVKNQHAASCGKMPDWVQQRPVQSWFSYFENAHTEQWVMLCLPDRLLLAGGDVSWKTYTYEAKDGKQLTRAEVVALTDTIDAGLAVLLRWPAGLILSAEERSWIQTCLRTFAQTAFCRRD